MTLAMTTRAKLAALAIVAPALFLPMKAAAQQATSSKPDYSVCEPLRGSATRPGAYVQCLEDTLTAHTRQMQAESARAREESARARQQSAEAREGIRAEATLRSCLVYLKDQKAAGRSLGTITRENACTLARQMGMQPG